MKGNFIITLIIGLLLIATPAWADDSKETWAAGERVGDRTFNTQGTVTITLLGDVYLSGTITVDGPATTVRFLNTSGKEVTIYNDGDAIRTAPMFKVINGSKLAFNYRDYPSNLADNIDGSNSIYKRIIIDGGAGFSDMEASNGEWVLTPAANGKMFRTSMIQSLGALELYHVVLQNYNGENSSVADGSGAIGLAPPRLYPVGSNLNYRYTRVVCSVIKKCQAVSGSALSVGKNYYLNQSQDPNDADRMITFLNDTIQECVQYGDSNGWGGAFRFRGSSHHSLTLKNTVFTSNFSQGDGAGLWWNAAGHKNTKCFIDECVFKLNTAMRESGGLRLETSFEIADGTLTVVAGNEALGKTKVVSGDSYTYVDDDNYKGNGAGIHLYGYSGPDGTVGGTFTYNLPQTLSVYKNKAAGYGGGIAFDFTSPNLQKGTKIQATFNNVRVFDNEAGKGGGGIYFNNSTPEDSLYVFDVFLNSANIYLNEALDGGGLYVNEVDIKTDATNGGEVIIRRNKATSGNGGGILLNRCKMTLNSADISENSATNPTSWHGGGGVYVHNSSFSLNGGSIRKNTTDRAGGGVCIYNFYENVADALSLSGGVISDNVAYNGGGVAVYGANTLSIEGVTIENNRAKRGGGLYLQGLPKNKQTNVVVRYHSGLVRNNIAEADAPIETACDGSFTGVGGGIYLSEYSGMEFPEMTQFGIYGNIAENAADDIYGCTKYARIDLPNVENLDLSGYQEARVHKLFWGEDYVTNDPNYDKGTKMKGQAWDTDKTNQRYRDVLNKQVEGKYYTIDFDGAASKLFDHVDGVSPYLCLTLGWSINAVKLIKEGMKDGENAIFKIFKKENDAYSEYMTVILTDQDKRADGTRCKEITLNSDGVWKIEEVNWSWAYTPAVSFIEKELDAADTDVEFCFKNTLKDDIPVHDESIITNKMENNNEN